MKALKDPDPEVTEVSHGLKSALKFIFASSHIHYYVCWTSYMPWWPGGPTEWIRLGSQNEPKSGLDLRPVKNVNLLKDIAVLPLSMPF